MPVDARLERLYDRIELIAGKGNPDQGKLCIMSFVAFLAGEAHSDGPDTASGVIRYFAMCVNDAMPADTRQRLKPFAPRIIGTNDGHDETRGHLLYDALIGEILPQLESDCRRTSRSTSVHFWLRFINPSLDPVQSQFGQLLSEAKKAHQNGLWKNLGTCIAKALLDGAGLAREPRAQDWYWNKAIELLDRLCDVGPGDRVVGVRPNRIERMDRLLSRPDAAKEAPNPLSAVLQRFRVSFSP